MPASVSCSLSPHTHTHRGHRRAWPSTACYWGKRPPPSASSAPPGKNMCVRERGCVCLCLCLSLSLDLSVCLLCVCVCQSGRSTPFSPRMTNILRHFSQHPTSKHPKRHHATPSQAMGFCFFNNAGVAALHARAAHGLKRVACVDVVRRRGESVFVYMCVYVPCAAPLCGQRTQTQLTPNTHGIPTPKRHRHTPMLTARTHKINHRTCITAMGRKISSRTTLAFSMLPPTWASGSTQVRLHALPLVFLCLGDLCVDAELGRFVLVRALAMQAGWASFRCVPRSCIATYTYILLKLNAGTGFPEERGVGDNIVNMPMKDGEGSQPFRQVRLLP